MDEIVERVRRSLRSGYCVPVVGAGVSIPAGADSWRSHLTALANGLDPVLMKLAQEETADPTEVATLLLYERRRNGLPPVPIYLPLPSNLHRALAGWRCRLYLTTNFDDGLERALQDQGFTPTVLPNDDLEDLNLEACFRAQSDSWQPTVVRLCSSLRRRNPGAETREDFAKLVAGESSALDCLTTVLRSCTTVFVGCGMGDPLLNAAIDRCFASKLGFPKPIAFVPEDMRRERKQSLILRGVQLAEYQTDSRTDRLHALLEKCGSRIAGPHHLLVFEPGTAAKLDQLLQAVGRLCHSVGISILGIITVHSALAQEVRRWGEAQTPPVQTETFVVRNTQQTGEVLDAISTKSVLWTALLTPYEYVTGDTAAFAKEYSSRLNRQLRFHTVEATDLSRNKPMFKDFLQQRFKGHSLISPTIYEQIVVPPDATWEGMLNLVQESRPGQECRQVVVKPTNAASSIGVRPLNLDDQPQCQRELKDLLRVLRSMPVQWETSRCHTGHVLVEERLLGEEFSVESRRTDQQIEVIAAHWKVDIDSDPSRFFERLFITLHSEHPVYSALTHANTTLLQEMRVGPGVFHAEYRMSPDLQTVHPIEVGLRPGGGMVNYSVYAARGIDLYEAAVRCALGVEGNPVSVQSIVATGLVFATKAEGGVLPLLRFIDSNGSLAVIRGDVESLRERLQRLIDTADRRLAHQRLRDVLCRENDLCMKVRDALPDLEAQGLHADIDLVEVWMEPGALISEEEAAYVAGLRIVAHPNQTPEVAMAEAVAAMRLCLDSLKCEPEKPLQTFSWQSSNLTEERPQWWQEAKNSSFRSDLDSWTFSRGIQNVLNESVQSVIDLGCGSAKPAIPLIQARILYAGIDIQEAAIREARANIARVLASANCTLLQADILNEDWLADLRSNHRQSQWEAVVANLPYLPGPSNILHIDVDGGADGLRYVPDRVFQVAHTLGAKLVLLNISSLSDIDTFALRVARKGYGVIRVVATIAPLEEYSRSVLEYLRKQRFVRIFGAGDDLRQVIYSFTLTRGRGISIMTTVRQIDQVLKPNANAVGTIVEGVSCW